MEAFPKFGCAILGYKKAPAGTPTTRTEFVKIKKWSEMGRRGSESRFETSFVEEMLRSSDLDPSRTEKVRGKIKTMRFFYRISAALGLVRSG